MNILINISIGSLLASLLVSCVTVPKAQLDAKLNAWLNYDIEQLIKYWGLPSSQRQVGDNYYAEWIDERNEPGNMSVSLGGGSHSGGSGIGVGLNLLGLGGQDDKCTRLVTYSANNQITKLSWQGDKDYCFEVTPDRLKVEQYQQ